MNINIMNDMYYLKAISSKSVNSLLKRVKSKITIEIFAGKVHMILNDVNIPRAINITIGCANDISYLPCLHSCYKHRSSLLASTIF